MTTEMASDRVVELIRWLDCQGITLHVDGGWAVDALIGKQTREHSDLDIAIKHDDVPKLRDLLESRGYKEIPRDDSWACNFVLADNQGHVIDIHSYVFDENGEHVYGCGYSIESLTGLGKIEDLEVPCIAPEWLVRFHCGYKIDHKDFHDVSLLCRKFDLDLPPEYLVFINNDSVSEQL